MGNNEEKEKLMQLVKVNSQILELLKRFKVYPQTRRALLRASKVIRSEGVQLFDEQFDSAGRW